MPFADFDLGDLMLGLEFEPGPELEPEPEPGLQLLFEQQAFQLPPFLQQVSLLLGHR